MDSCHIFNFLFGTRKATSELRKCFSGNGASTRTSARENSPKSTRVKNSSTILANNDLNATTTISQVQPNKFPDSPRHHHQNQQQQQEPHKKSTNSSSPFKQIQLKLVNLAAGGSESSVSSSSVSPEPPVKRQNVEFVDQSCQDVADGRRTQLAATTGLACGIFEAQLVRLDNNDDNQIQDGQLLDENNNEDKTRAPLKVIVENPANKLDNVDGDGDEIANDDVESSQNHKQQQQQPKQQQQEINVYDNPMITRDDEHEPVKQNPRTIPNRVSNDDKMNKSERVRNLVQSFEISATRQQSNHYQQQQQQQQQRDTTTPTNQSPPIVGLVRRLSRPPDTPPKSNRAKCLNLQLTLRKPRKVSSLFQDETFLRRYFFDKLAPIDRCAAAQVCRQWRTILYADKTYWKDLVGVIDCTQLRREHLVECILNTLQSARLKHQQHNHQLLQRSQGTGVIQHTNSNCNHNNQHHNSHHQNQHQLHLPVVSLDVSQNGDLYDLSQLDQDEIWRIQELCNRYTMRGFSNGLNCTVGHANSTGGQSQPNRTSSASQNDQNDATTITTNTQQTTSGIANSKSSSSQISSSTLSSISISSLLSPLSESSRVDSIREKLYTALDERGFDSICLFGATDDDIEDLTTKTRPNGAQKQVKLGRLSNCSISDRGLDVFVSTFGQIEELELTGCNEITNNIDLRGLRYLRRLIITDCINIADGLAQRLIEIFHQLDVLVVQAYHLTDAFLEFISLNSDTSQLKRLELPNCKEITNTSALTIAKHFQSVEQLSLSGSTKINDDGIEILAEHMKSLVNLDLGWLKIGDLSLECVACDLRQLRELILDRNVHITDLGLGYLATMANLTLLYVRWCPQLTDKSIKSISNMRSLTKLSLAGLHQITARGILSLLDSQQLEELELTNCPAVTGELQQFLLAKMPNCNIIY